MAKEYRELSDKEKKWILRLQKVMNAAPDSLFMFVGAGITIYAMDKDKQPYMIENGSIDGNAPGYGIDTKMRYDGGDY